MYNKVSKQTDIIGATIIVVAVIFTSLISWMLYRHTVDLLTNNLRENLEAIVKTGVVQFNPKDVSVLKKEDDYKKQEWVTVVNQLRKIRENNNNIIFSYILSRSVDDPKKIVFAADSHSINPYANTDNDSTNDIDVDRNGVIDATDKLQWPGQEYEEPPSDVWVAFDRVTTTQELYQDEYGSFLTGYAPILNPEGNAVAVFAVDIIADEFFGITRQTLNPFLIFIAVLIAILIFLSLVIILIWNKRIVLFAELDRQKDALLSMVSHQLAKPITAIKWNLESMADGDSGALTKDQKDGLTIMQTMARNLTDLVGMILNVSRIQLGKIILDPQPLDLQQFFDELFPIIEPTIKDKKINFVKKMPLKLPIVLLDKRYTRMAVENLLTNAVKYTPEGGTVTMEIRIENGKLWGQVSDTGCGIPKAEQSKIFDKMFRASNVRNTVEGNGFGLFVAKGAVEGQGGKMAFTSVEGKGTVFSFEMPAKPAPDSSKGAAAQAK